MPKVSVIMSVYNSERYVGEAVKSILEQTFTDFELIVVDDCSPDGSMNIVRSFDDARIRIIENKQNMGLAWSINRAIDVAGGEYIARMDSDDISIPTRLEKQVKYMDSHTDIICYGSWARYFGNKMPMSLRFKHKLHIFDTFRVPLKDDDIKASLLFWIPFVHPTVMFRRSALEQFGLRYNPEFRRSQDYELWSRLCFCGKSANTSEPLLHYRLSASNAGTVSHIDQLKAREIVSRRVLESLLGYTPSEEQMQLHIKIFDRQPLSKNELSSASTWLCKIADSAKESDLFSHDSVLRAASAEWRRLCYSSQPFPSNFNSYFPNKELGRISSISLYDWIMFLLYRIKNIL